MPTPAQPKKLLQPVSKKNNSLKQALAKKNPPKWILVQKADGSVERIQAYEFLTKNIKPTLGSKLVAVFAKVRLLIDSLFHSLGRILWIPFAYLIKLLPPMPWLTSFRVAIILSLSLHAYVLSINFVAPAIKKWTEPPIQITAILVNSSSKDPHQDPQFIAQATLQGGGQQERFMVPTSPLQKALKTQLGHLDASANSPQIQQQAQQIAQLEQQIQNMISQLDKKSWTVPQEQPEPATVSESTRKLQMDLAAQIEKELWAYAMRPKKRFVGVNAVESDLALWIEGWQRKVQYIGNQYYPEQARGRVRGELIVTVGIKADGSVESVNIDKSSGHKVLDEAARRIVSLSAPFARFDQSMHSKVDILYITRLWRFGPEGFQQANAQSN